MGSKGIIVYNELIFNEPFVNDELVVGKWKVVGFHGYDALNSEIDVTPFLDYNHHEIYFLPDGAGYWIYEGWTKGKLCTWAGGDDPYIHHAYDLTEINGQLYLFLKTNEDDKTFINILVKVSDKQFTVDDFAIRENVNLPFVEDDDVFGEWFSVGFVDMIDEFTGEDLRDDLWMNKIVFEKDGKVTRYYDHESLWDDLWTKGKLLDLGKELVSNYVFKTIRDETYLFIEWKMGNYKYGHFPPMYYVLRKGS